MTEAKLAELHPERDDGWVQLNGEKYALCTSDGYWVGVIYARITAERICAMLAEVDRLRTEKAAAVNDALERAAALAEEDGTHVHLADRIRALKEPT